MIQRIAINRVHAAYSLSLVSKNKSEESTGVNGIKTELQKLEPKCYVGKTPVKK
jgi:hypothetical protein